MSRATVYLLTSGDGEDGNPWQLHGVFATRQAAEAAKADHERPRRRKDGSTFFYPANEIEEWEVQ